MSARPLLPLLLLAACNPYVFPERARVVAVDGAAFPAPYRAPRARAASVDGAAIAYYLFPAAGDAIAPAPAYVFDPAAAIPRCTAPAGYVYDARRDGVRRDEQGPIFTALPDDAYVPVVAEVPVTTNGEACQAVRAAGELDGRSDVIVGAPDGTWRAWAIVDAAAAGGGPERLGWYETQLVAYLDGGVVPATGDGAHAVAQDLFVPTATPDGAGAVGSGWDVLAARRGDAGYSPLCRVRTFVPADPLHPPTRASDIDAATVADTGALVWCLQP